MCVVNYCTPEQRHATGTHGRGTPPAGQLAAHTLLWVGVYIGLDPWRALPRVLWGAHGCHERGQAARAVAAIRVNERHDAECEVRVHLW